MEDRDDSTTARQLMLAACAAGFFWILVVHVLTGFLDFIAKDGVGSRSGMVGNIDAAITTRLSVAGIGAAWLVSRTPYLKNDLAE